MSPTSPWGWRRGHPRADVDNGVLQGGQRVVGDEGGWWQWGRGLDPVQVWG